MQTANRPDEMGRFGQFGGRFVPETLMPALAELETAYRAAQSDESFQARLAELGRQLRGPAHPAVPRRAAVGGAGRRPGVPEAGRPGTHRRPQDQQRPGSGAAGQAHGQEPGDRRDRRRPTRRRHGHGVRHAATGVRGVHGRGGHTQAVAERVQDAPSRRRGAPRVVRQPHAEGRHQRMPPGLGHERRDHPLPDRQRRGPTSLSPASCATSRRCWARRRGSRLSPPPAVCPTTWWRASGAAATP